MRTSTSCWLAARSAARCSRRGSARASGSATTAGCALHGSESRFAGPRAMFAALTPNGVDWQVCSLRAWPLQLIDPALLQKLFEDIHRRQAAKPTRAAEPVSEQLPPTGSEAAPQQASVTVLDTELPAPREVGTVSGQSAPLEPSPVSGAQPDSGGSGGPQPGSSAASSSAPSTSTLGESSPQAATAPHSGQSEPGGAPDGIATHSRPALGSGDAHRVDPVSPSSLPGTGEETDTQAGT